MSIKHFIQQEQFYHFFQPIYHLNERGKVGYEVLLRSEKYQNPEIAFQEAKKEKQLFELDSKSLLKALSTYDSTGLSKKDGILFLNVFPSTILHPNFSTFLNDIITNNFLSRQQVVLEISESELIEDLDVFKEKISDLKKQGFLIAIDDVGKAYSSVKSIIELEPDFLKLDRYFADDLHRSNKKQDFISFFVHYSNQTKCDLILEGVEKKEELDVAKSLGVPIAQGYYLGKPDFLK